MNTLYLLCLALASILTFYFGKQFGENKKLVERLVLCGVDNSVVAATPIIDLTNVQNDVDCEPQSTIACDTFENRKMNVLVQASSTTPEDIFGFLHHPSSPSKWNYYITKDNNWKSKKILESPCEEIYLTRSGSRANQPNKCVAVAIVPEGYTSINQQSHRKGKIFLSDIQN